MGTIDVLQCVWTCYWHALLTAYVLSVAASLLNVHCGLLLRAYTEALLALFELCATYAKSHEEADHTAVPVAQQQLLSSTSDCSQCTCSTSTLGDDCSLCSHAVALRKCTSDRERRARTHSGGTDGVSSRRRRVDEPVRNGLIHREAIDALRHKLRRRTHSGPVLDTGQQHAMQAPPPATAARRVASRKCIDIVVDDSLDFVKAGFESIIQDEFNQAMEVEELPCWNLLSRNKFSYPNLPVSLVLVWMLGVVWRYMICFPVRAALFMSALVWLALGGLLHHCVNPLNEQLKKRVGVYVMSAAFRMFSKSMSCLTTYHNVEKRTVKAALCVANHTSPIDCAVLSVEQVMALTGQKHTGGLGYLESRLSALSPHLWFDRSVRRDRTHVKRAIARYLRNEHNPPLLIFPEGVCINNTAVVQFRKGAFEAVDSVRPIAVKYDAKFADAFWWQDTWLQHIVHLMTSWALVVDVYFLDEMTRKPGQPPEHFADEVKAAISQAGGMRFLEWDGFLKMYTIKPAQRETEKRDYFEHLLRHVDLNGLPPSGSSQPEAGGDKSPARRKTVSFTDSDAATQTDVEELDALGDIAPPAAHSRSRPSFGLHDTARQQ